MRNWMMIACASVVILASSVYASTGNDHTALRKEEWSFDGIFGHVDKASAQRGFQVYSQVCASCHSLNLVSYRSLMHLGFSEAEVKAIAAQVTVTDGPNEDGEMFERPGRISDRFVAPYANEQAARASNGGALPPDLSLMIKARPDGANYVHSILTGYEEAPADMHMAVGMNYNRYFPGNQIAMPAPLSEGVVEYQDGTEANVEQMSKDVVNFLQWAAEPEMEARKGMGLKVLIYLAIFTLLFFAAKKVIWRDIK